MPSLRDPRAGITFDARFTSGVKLLLIVTVAAYFVQTVVALLFPGGGAFLSYNFGLVPHLVTHGLRLWQPVTYLFLHGGLWHLLINLFALWLFGRQLEDTWGQRRFLTYFFITGVGAGLVVVAVKTLMDPGGAVSPGLMRGISPAWQVTVGNSGAIYGLLMACAVLYPERRIWMFPFPGLIITMKMFALIWGAIAFFGTLSDAVDGVSHVCHLSGMLVGWLYLRRNSLFYGLRNRVSDWKRRRLRRKFEVYLREHPKDPPSRPDNWVN